MKAVQTASHTVLSIEAVHLVFISVAVTDLSNCRSRQQLFSLFIHMWNNMMCAFLLVDLIFIFVYVLCQTDAVVR